MRMVMMLTAVTLTLAACGGGGADRPVDNQAAAETGAAADVARLDETQRNGVLERAIRASGAACPMVASSERAEVRHAVTGWRAHCNNDTAHLLEILPDGTAKVTSRTH
ncbi:MAG: hypothetical protein AB7E60_14550 [Sphingobium sp.]